MTTLKNYYKLFSPLNLNKDIKMSKANPLTLLKFQTVSEMQALTGALDAKDSLLSSLENHGEHEEDPERPLVLYQEFHQALGKMNEVLSKYHDAYQGYRFDEDGVIQ